AGSCPRNAVVAALFHEGLEDRFASAPRLQIARLRLVDDARDTAEGNLRPPAARLVHAQLLERNLQLPEKRQRLRLVGRVFAREHPEGARAVEDRLAPAALVLSPANQRVE